MKKTLIYILITSTLPFNCWAQKKLLNETRIINSQNNGSIPRDINRLPARKVKYYHVEEIVDSKFGGHKTVYNVTNPKLIQTHDLGLNGKRIISPVFQEEKQYVETVIKSDSLNRNKNTQFFTTSTPTKSDLYDLDLANKKIAPKESPDRTVIELSTKNNFENSTKLSITNTPEKANPSAYIDIIKNYESVVEKGYETLEILKKLADSYYFSNELEKAEKYYHKLFNKTTDLEPEYFYRFSIALKSVGQMEKSKEFLKKYKTIIQ